MFEKHKTYYTKILLFIIIFGNLITNFYFFW